MFENEDILVPTVEEIRDVAMQDAARLQINWENIKTDEARRDMEGCRHFVKRIPALEKLYNTWRTDLVTGDESAREATMYVFKNIVEELVASYQTQDMMERYDLVNAITGLDNPH